MTKTWKYRNRTYVMEKVTDRLFMLNGRPCYRHDIWESVLDDECPTSSRMAKLAAERHVTHLV